MNATHKIGLAVALAATLALGGCWDDDDDVVSEPAALEIPDSAAASSAAFVSYVSGLAGGDETASR